MGHHYLQFCERIKTNSANTRHTWSHFYCGGCKIKPTIHIAMDPMIQLTNKKTTRPARMVRSGGPDASSLDFVSSDFSEGFVFDADKRLHLLFACTCSSFFNLKGEKTNEDRQVSISYQESPSIYPRKKAGLSS